MLSRRARPPRGHADRAAAAVVLLWRGQDRALVRVRQRPLHAAVDAPRARAALARRLARPLSFPPLPDQVRAGRGARCSGRRVLGSARAAAALGRCGRLRDGFSRRDARLHPGDAGAVRRVLLEPLLRLVRAAPLLAHRDPRLRLGGPLAGEPAATRVPGRRVPHLRRGQCAARPTRLLHLPPLLGAQRVQGECTSLVLMAMRAGGTCRRATGA
mmetsp:Transcript_40580/g.131316  ORF Transcript_40580/g.131316 Transcript_40580/m.131316 type:complete len:214 (-) Transcript_40580:702-1343(-)